MLIIWFQELAFHEEEKSRNKQVRCMVHIIMNATTVRAFMLSVVLNLLPCMFDPFTQKLEQKTSLAFVNFSLQIDASLNS